MILDRIEVGIMSSASVLVRVNTNIVIISVYLHVLFSSVNSLSHIGKIFYLTFPNIGAASEVKGTGVSLYFYTTTQHGIEVNVSRLSLLQDSNWKDFSFFVLSRRLRTKQIKIKYLKTFNETYTDSALFKFESHHEFSLSVIIVCGRQKIASFQAVPFDSWGQSYIAFTLSSEQFLYVVSSEWAHTVSFISRSTEINWDSKGSNVSLRLENKMIVDDSDETKSNRKSFCADNSNNTQSLKGTTIQCSDPLGVVLSNCPRMSDCGSPGNSGSLKGLALEMLLPTTFFGREFFTISTNKLTAPGVLLLQSHLANTTLCVSIERRGCVDIYTIDEPGAGLYIETLPGSRKIKSDQSIQVMYIMRPPCPPDHDLLGDFSVTLLIPTHFFYTEYVWSTVIWMSLWHYVIVLIQNAHIANLTLNKENLSINWTRVIGDARWSSGEKQVTKGPQYLTAGDSIRFGCYAYGIGHRVGYIHAPGYDNSANGSYVSTTDQSVDYGNGGLNNSRNNSEEIVQVHNSTKEFYNCLPYSWGRSCQKNCRHCQDSCRAEDGVCQKCKPGFKNPKRGCSDECGINYFGQNCSLSCLLKCGIDCDERVKGTCPVPDYNYHYLLFVALGICLLAGWTTFNFSKRKTLERSKTNLAKIEEDVQEDVETLVIQGGHSYSSFYGSYI